MTNNKKILLSAYACEPDGGPEAVIGWNFAVNLAKFHHVWVITRESNRKSIERYRESLIQNQINWLYFDWPKPLRFWKKGSRGHRLYYFLWQLGIFFKIKTIHQKENFNIVHHVTFVNYWQPSFLPFLKNVNFVFGPVGGGEYVKWNFIKHFPTKEIMYETVRNLSRFINIANPLLRLAAKKSRVAIAVNKETATQLAKIGHKDIRVLTQVALDHHQLNVLKKIKKNNDYSFRFFSIGRLLTWKGFDMAIEAFSQIAKKNEAIEYYIIGDGPYRAQLNKMIKRKDIVSKVKFFGKLTHPELFNLMNKCDVLLHPSLHDSGALVVAEAMAAGKPVICLDVGGPAYQVNENVGIKIPPRTRKQVVHDLAEAMELLVTDKKLYQKMSVEARKRVVEELNWDSKIKIINRIYDEIIN